MNNVQTINKAAIALEIYKEEAAKGDDKLRARCIARFKAEPLNMGPQGASTYFQNCKKKAAGLKVPHYYKRKTPVKAEVAAAVESLLLLTHQASERWIAVQNGVEISFRTRGEAQAFAKVNGGEWKDRNKAA